MALVKFRFGAISKKDASVRQYALTVPIDLIKEFGLQEKLGTYFKADCKRTKDGKLVILFKEVGVLDGHN
ncbi:MAG: hypothetical protein RMI79_06995 [Nitrososphaerota archaeon]|nr:hypothetical protein [Nitrososphaerota archaeon]